MKKKKKIKTSARLTAQATEGGEGTGKNLDPTQPASEGEVEIDKKTGKKKKKKKKKLTKEERAKLKLENEIKGYTSDESRLEALIRRVNRWLDNNEETIVDLFRAYDHDGSGIISYSDFKSAMLDLSAPCTLLEMHIICTLIDEDASESIDFLEFTKGLEYERERPPELEQGLPQLQLYENVLTEHCSCCNLLKWEPFKEPFPRYISLELRMITFDNMRKYPGHMTKLVHAHRTVYSVCQLIISELKHATTRLTIFRDKSRHMDAILPYDHTLAECGFEGSYEKDEAEEVRLFYDYTVEFDDCPILCADYYFTKSKINI